MYAPTRNLIPWLMAAGRAMLGLALVIGENCGWSGATLASIVIVALLSDIFDGILARRWNCDTAAVRLFDSMADTVFYLCAVLAVYTGLPAIWHAYRSALMLLLAMEGARILFDLAKFRKPASYHSYLAKTWGLVLAAAVVTLFATQRTTPMMTAAVILGILCNLESAIMSLILPTWNRDVKTLQSAWRLRAPEARAIPARGNAPRTNRLNLRGL